MHIIKLSAIASTNSYLKNLASNTHLQDGTIVVAEEQTGGRGQRGAVWHSKRGKSLTFSVFKRFEFLAAHRHFSLSMTVSLALARVLIKYKIPLVSVKWPNDIMSAQKKCAGILVENKLDRKHIAHSVIGVGLNVNERDLKDIPHATSLFQQTGVQLNLDELLLALSVELLNELGRLETTPDSVIQQAYEQLLFRKNKISVFEDRHQHKKNGIIRGVTQAGLLRVEHDDDQFDTYDIKQVRLCY